MDNREISLFRFILKYVGVFLLMNLVVVVIWGLPVLLAYFLCWQGAIIVLIILGVVVSRILLGLAMRQLTTLLTQK